MKKINLKHILVIISILLLISIISFIQGKYFILPISLAVMVYDFVFIAGLFFGLYEKETFLTKHFLSNTKMPVYISTIAVVAMIYLKKKTAFILFQNQVME